MPARIDTTRLLLDALGYKGLPRTEPEQTTIGRDWKADDPPIESSFFQIDDFLPSPKTVAKGFAAALGGLAPVGKQAIKSVKQMLNPDKVYYIRRSGHIEDDFKRNWSSWNFGGDGFEGTKKEFYDYLASSTDRNPISLSGFDIPPDRIKEYEFGELYPGYWVAIDRINAREGLSAHYFDVEGIGAKNIDDILTEVQKKPYRYDGTGEGTSFDARSAKVVYSDDDLHIIESDY